MAARDDKKSRIPLQMLKDNEIDRAVQEAIILEMNRIFKVDSIQSTIDFIEDYCYIEDADSQDGTGRLKHHLWPGQKRTLEEIEEHKMTIILKARQMGVTWISLEYGLHQCMKRVGFRVICLSKDDEDAKALIDRVEFLLSNLPPWMALEYKNSHMPTYKGYRWIKTAHNITVFHPGGGKSEFIAKPATRGAGRSLTASLVIQDEWAFQNFSFHIFSASFPTINRPTGGKFIGLSTAFRGTLFEEIWTNKEQYGFHGIFLAWWVDPRRNQEWYDRTKKALMKDKLYMQEYPATPEEAFSGGDRKGFPEFSKEIHCRQSFPIPAHWRKWASLDNGYADPFAWYKFAVDEEGTVYCYEEYTRDYKDEKVYYTDQGKKFMETCECRKLDRYGDEEDSHENLQFIVAGHDAWNQHHRDASGKTLIDYYREGGIEYGFIKAVTDRKTGKATVHEYLKPIWCPDLIDPETNEPGMFIAKVVIFEDKCPKLVETLPQVLTEEENREVIEDSKIDHWYDSFRYGLNAHHIKESKPEKKQLTKIQEHKLSLFKKNRKKKTF